MSFIAEFELSTPILRETAVASSKLAVEQIYRSGDDTTKLVFWAYGDDPGAIEAALENDPTVAEYSLLEALSERRLYSAALTEWGTDLLIYPAAATNDISFRDVTVTGDGETRIRARVPSREALQAYRESCLERDLGFRLRRIFRESESETSPYGVSSRQREALLAALEAGYFDVPREATLAAVAEELEISDQALSARLRRGQAALLRNTLATADPT
ncbi:helix-turn-helix domain-containing protein [Natronococcus jeotgali]|uniref:Bacterio-opsin activator HTH domain-containing protein n=1 Tax=Natronococcus jeotgali DSM 18795 TaxID=1227498 RepID=L9WQ33_9EURY|nr:helix-turn-helix domain-containing protein [Natronococcus jeotgali]ELY51574.1 bacterio-opsin activator HTH domain-containing protein [Natronococcus jeotgali DSM 18795]